MELNMEEIKSEVKKSESTSHDQSFETKPSQHAPLPHVIEFLNDGQIGDKNGSLTWNFSKFRKISSSRLYFNGDFADRLNYEFTGLILFTIICIVTIKQCMGRNIQCFIPQEFTRGWEEYAEEYCWVSKTFWATQPWKPISSRRSTRMIQYHQWTQLVLAIQMVLLFVPFLIWHLLMKYSGFNVNKILQIAFSSKRMFSVNRNSQHLARYLEDCIYRQHDHTKMDIACGRYNGIYLVVLYSIVKLFSFLNIFGQMYMMECFMGAKYRFFGIRILYDLVTGKDTTQADNFPLVFFCDFEAKKVGKNSMYSLQCVLPFNLFLEKVYVFLWFWYLIIGIATFISIFNWVLTIVFHVRNHNFVRRYLNVGCTSDQIDEHFSQKFVEDFLKLDGVFIIRMIALNCDHSTATDVTYELWAKYRRNRLDGLHHD